MNKRTIFYFDMDGVLAEFKTGTPIKDLYEKNYFFNLKPLPNIVNAVKTLIKEDAKSVFICSAVFKDHKTALKEKNLWLNKYIPEIKPSNRIFTVAGESKVKHIKKNKKVALIDDYGFNLLDFQENCPNGLAIKVSTSNNDMLYEKSTHKFDEYINPEQDTETIFQILRSLK